MDGQEHMRYTFAALGAFSLVACLLPPAPINALESSHSDAPFRADIARAALAIERDVSPEGLSARVLWVGVEGSAYHVESDALGGPARQAVPVFYVYEVRKDGQSLGRCFLGANSFGSGVSYAELSREHLGGGRYADPILTHRYNLRGLAELDSSVRSGFVHRVDCDAVSRAKGGWRPSSEPEPVQPSPPKSSRKVVAR